mmetsp:Transcript_132858/g.384125  ORF Transcript_132858/g.384125 Transcript_132858/m.384125 type:complete len:298 (-) Transcript_132858:23-916(-)
MRRTSLVHMPSWHRSMISTSSCRPSISRTMKVRDTFSDEADMAGEAAASVMPAIGRGDDAAMSPATERRPSKGTSARSSTSTRGTATWPVQSPAKVSSSRCRSPSPPTSFTVRVELFDGGLGRYGLPSIQGEPPTSPKSSSSSKAKRTDGGGSINASRLSSLKKAGIQLCSGEWRNISSPPWMRRSEHLPSLHSVTIFVIDVLAPSPTCVVCISRVMECIFPSVPGAAETTFEKECTRTPGTSGATPLLCLRTASQGGNGNEQKPSAATSNARFIVPWLRANGGGMAVALRLLRKRA